MKLHFKNLPKISLLLMAGFFMLIGCQKDSELPSTNIDTQPEAKVHSTYDFEGYTYQELQSDTSFANAMGKIGKSLKKPSESMKGGNAFTIDSAMVKVVSVNEKAYYTFLIHRERPTAGYFENLVVVISESSEARAYILKYTPSGTEENVYDFKGGIEVASIPMEEAVSAKQITICYRVHTVMCNQEGSCGGRTYIGTHVADPWCCTNTNYLYTSYSDECTNYETGGGGGGGGGTSGPKDPGGIGDDDDIYTSPSADLEFREKEFVKWYLTANERYYYYGNESVRARILGFLYYNGYFTGEAQGFAGGLLEELRHETSVDEDALSFVFDAYRMENIDKSLTGHFLLATNAYTTIDFNANPEVMDPFAINFVLKCAMLRVLNPELCDGLSEWRCKAKIIWLASKEGVHIALDVFGLVPVVGEVADLINGGLYLLEGDGVNATLSFAAAIPVAGWVATGAKGAVRIVEASNIASKVKLTWKVDTSTGKILWPSDNYSRKQLRKVLGLTSSTTHAHHIIPLTFKEHDLVQKAAKSSNAFHINEMLNGIPLPSTNHLTGHNVYINKIRQKIDGFNLDNPSANVAFDRVNNLINQIRTHVQNNPNMNLGQIADLIE